MSYEIYQLGKCIDCSSDPEEIKKRWDELRLSEHYSGERVVIQPFEIQEDDTLRHTPEWFRIQERLKRSDELEARLEEETLQFSRLYEDLKQTREALRQIVGLVPDYTNPEEYCMQVRLLASLREPVVKESFTTRKEGE